MEAIKILTENDIKQMVTDIVSALKKNEQPTVEDEKEEKLLTSEEVCKILRCSRPTLHRWKRAGLIDFVRIGKNIRYKQTDLEKLIETKGGSK
ncbi:MAG: Helix-turn-helix domain [Bacteroidota bacterium]|jgi:excisionase family DNA binding protein|nr:Helix-turn-helix domain [Bacteroidota bacterium]